HSGISFTFFAGGASTGELGRGGRYQAGDPAAAEPATGFTLYTDTILRTLPRMPAPRRLLLPLAADRGRAEMLREQGWITVAALDPVADWRAEARRLGCGHVLEGGEPAALG
ncbi:MAG: ATP phosphoribosyltransferase regulatory subunit, partial [Stellaceae bacterium]